MEGGCSLLGSMQIKQSAAQSPDAGRKPGGGLGAGGGGGVLLGSNHHVQIKQVWLQTIGRKSETNGLGGGAVQLGS